MAGDFNAQLRPGIDSECDLVGKHTTGEPNKRGIWMKQWLMIQNYVAVKTTFKNHPKTIHFQIREWVNNWTMC